MKLSWLLRGTTWRTFHVHRCLECKRMFADTDEPGCWTRDRSDEYPELCSPYSCQTRKDGSRSHTLPHCRSWGPYCSACAPKVEARLLEIRQAYGGW